MNNCRKIRSNLAEYVENSLNVNEADIVKQHLAGCKECTAFAEELRSCFHTMDKEISRIEADPFMSARIVATFENRQTSTKHSAKFRILQPVFAVLILLIVVFSGILIGRSFNYTNQMAADYQNEILYLTDLQGLNIEPLTQSE